ncbi:MAG: NAD(P)/FAD-dependent oxidoreductase [Bryobacteraceae bacterium]|nr:NAD(P)/FAD-dependent oxidoreductase [Bryobacteraceae bacterium]
MSHEYDGIVLGSGHNGLILVAYAGLAGMKVLCLERNAYAGGGLVTASNPRHPGFLHNTHSFYHRAIRQMPWYSDLGLARRGAHYLEPELNTAMILASGETLEWWTDFEKTVESFAAWSAQDARQLRLWRDRFLPVVERILIPESQSPPMPREERRRLLERTAEGRLLLEVSALSPLEFVEREFTHPVIQAGLLFFNGLREVDLRCRGFGHHIAALLAASGKAQMCVGGSAALARALVTAVEETGGAVKLQAEPRRILMEGGRAVGVETKAGEVFRARHFVASSLNPQQTFLDLMDDADVPAAWRAKAADFRYNLLAPLFALHVALEAAPVYRAARSRPYLDRAFMVILGLEDVRQFTEIVRHHEAGTIPPTVMWGTCPTVFDPTQAPPGRHTAFWWEKLPYRLHGDAANWDREKDAHGRRMMDIWKRYAPDVEDTLIDQWTLSPIDAARSLPNMRDGDLLVGAFTNDQYGYHRPFPGAGQYRTHAEGLYLCGSSSHPGGNITGLPGYNCAQVLLADMGLSFPGKPH